MKESLRKSLIKYVIMLVLKKWNIYVADIIKKLSTNKFVVVEGTLYPLLNRLKKEWLVSYEWIESPLGPPRKHYSLTTEWENMLNEMDEERKELTKNINQIS